MGSFPDWGLRDIERGHIYLQIKVDGKSRLAVGRAVAVQFEFQ